VVTLNGKDFYLGRFDTQDSKAAYDRLIAEWLSNGRRLPTTDSFTVAELIERFWAHAKVHYRRPDGTPTSEIHNYRSALRPLNHLYGATLAKDFGPLAFKAVRQLLVTGYDHLEFPTENGHGVKGYRVCAAS
jgi:hypothetical protein